MDKKSYLQQVISTIKAKAKGYTVILLTNIRNQTKAAHDFPSFSVSSEYYSKAVEEKIAHSLEKIGFTVKRMYDEEDFIMHCLQSKHELNNTIVINSAQKGNRVGRKSLVPSFCDMLDINYIGSNPYIVSLCRDKYRSGEILNRHGIVTPEAWLYSSKYGWLDSEPNLLSGKLIVKPNYEASSIGINASNVIGDLATVKGKVKEMAKDFNQEIIVERFISGAEMEVPVICRDQPVSLFPVAITMDGDIGLGDRILDYTTRSENRYGFQDFSKINAQLSDKICQDAERVCKLLDIHGAGRVDFRVTADDEYFVTDVSTNPHYTENSSFFYPFIEWGFTYEDMVACIVGASWSRKETL